MKKILIVLCATAIGISTGNPFGNDPQGNVAYASNKLMNAGELYNNPTGVSAGNAEKFKAQFAYEMAQITAKIVSAPMTNVQDFKVEFAYATALVTAKVMPIIPSDGPRQVFAYEMARITTKIISAQNLNIETAKAEFSYEIALITTRIITNVDETTTDKKTMLKEYNDYIEPKSMGTVSNTGTEKTTTFLRNNADIEPKSSSKVNNVNTDQKAILSASDISPETYTSLVDELAHVGDRSNHVDNKVKIDGEIRYHYAANSGVGQWARNSSGLRVYLGADTAINKDWRAYGVLEGQKKLVNYNNAFKLSRLFVEGKIGTSLVKAGSFGYLMADGNIYDSGFNGVKFDFGGPVKYTVSYGKTDDTKKTSVATARYTDFDYSLEAGVYHYQADDSVQSQNTIRTLGGNYNFSNFSVGAMILGSSLKDSNGDSNGYVLSLNYGDLKTYRPGTYGVFAKYYNQPRGTYITHGMNGKGSSMQGFKGYGLGMNYTLAENFVAGIEYYSLTDKISGAKGDTWWNHLTRYF